MPGPWPPEPESTTPGLCACRSFAGEDSTCDRCGLRCLPLEDHVWNESTHQWERLPDGVDLGPPKVRPRPRRETTDPSVSAPVPRPPPDRSLDMAGRPLDPEIARLGREEEHLRRQMRDRQARLSRAENLVAQTGGAILKNSDAITRRLLELGRKRRGDY